MSCLPQAGRPPALPRGLRLPWQAAGPVRLKELVPLGRFAPKGGGQDRAWVSARSALRRTVCCLPGLREVGALLWLPHPALRGPGLSSRPLCPSLGPAARPARACLPVSLGERPVGPPSRGLTLTCEWSQQAGSMHAAVRPLTASLGSAGQVLPFSISRAPSCPPQCQEVCPPGVPPHPAVSIPARHRLCPSSESAGAHGLGAALGDPAEQGPRKCGAQGS